MEWINPLDALMDGIKSLFGNKLTEEEYAELKKKLDENMDKHTDEDGAYDWGAAPEEAMPEFSGLIGFFRGLNDVFMEIIAVPKYIYEKAQESPQTVAAALIGIIGILWVYKKKLF